MKTLVCLLLAAGAITGPSVSFAQSAPHPVTRAQVIAELVQLEKAGYTPDRGDDPNYPADIQAALAKIESQSPQQQTIQSQGGAVEAGSSEMGAAQNGGADLSI